MFFFSYKDRKSLSPPPPKKNESKYNFSRVDFWETFSSDQLWFWVISGLFQCCSLTKSLWKALIQLWTALKTKLFRAKNQSCTTLISYEIALSRADFWRIQNDNLRLILSNCYKIPKFFRWQFSTCFFLIDEIRSLLNIQSFELPSQETVWLSPQL